LIGRFPAEDNRNDSERLDQLVQQQFEVADQRPRPVDGTPQPKTRPLKGRTPDPDPPPQAPTGQAEGWAQDRTVGSLLRWLNAVGSDDHSYSTIYTLRGEGWARLCDMIHRAGRPWNWSPPSQQELRDGNAVNASNHRP
jgi:hypothetical protein